MAFELVKDGGVTEMIEVTISSLTLAVGDMLELDVGATAWTEADASTEHWQKKLVVKEPTTTADTLVKGIVVTDLQTWKCESANASDTADNGDRMLLTDKNTVNNSGSDSGAEEAVFVQLAPSGATTDNRIIGKFVGGIGVNPAAA